MRINNATIHQLTYFKAINEEFGKLQYCDCNKCKNKGYYYVFTEINNETDIEYIICDCNDKRKILQKIEKCKLKDVIRENTLKNFIIKEDWQRDLKGLVIQYIKDNSNNWLMLSGNSGSGKTMLAIATLTTFLKNKEIAYMKWKSESTKIVANISNAEIYQSLILPYKESEVLLIDDFLKTKGNDIPTSGIINLAIEIIDYRYENKLKTIITSEKSLDFIINNIDESIGSRIYEMIGKYYYFVDYNISNNYRLKGKD